LAVERAGSGRLGACQRLLAGSRRPRQNRSGLCQPTPRLGKRPENQRAPAIGSGTRKLGIFPASLAGRAAQVLSAGPGVYSHGF